LALVSALVSALANHLGNHHLAHRRQDQAKALAPEASHETEPEQDQLV
tara:strand:+ start:3647 stop:3790 length:144 start_codon:yes stop_codon:yes gene_type:complete